MKAKPAAPTPDASADLKLDLYVEPQFEHANDGDPATVSSSPQLTQTNLEANKLREGFIVMSSVMWCPTDYARVVKCRHRLARDSWARVMAKADSAARGRQKRDREA